MNLHYFTDRDKSRENTLQPLGSPFSQTVKYRQEKMPLKGSMMKAIDRIIMPEKTFALKTLGRISQ
jgi:hypothetical protein